MAGSRISVLIDVAVDGANRALGGFRQQLKDTEGAAGKMKLGLSSAFDFAKVNAGEFAMAAGAALVGFGVQAVGAFQDTALAAGELRDKLGLTAEDASKFIEVAGDMNIGVGDLESTIGRMNKTAGESPGKFDEIGASIVRNKDGTINVRDTFLSVVEALNAMPDAGERAKAGAEIFGRGWQSIAEMVAMGAGDLSTALDAIEVGKIISDEEVQDAREYREALDTLKGVVEELTIEVGGSLVPVLTDAAEGMIAVKDVAGELTGIIPGPLKEGFKLLGEQVQRSLFWPKYFLDLKGALGEAEEAVGTLGESITGYTPTVEDATGAAEAQEEAEKAAREELDRKSESLDRAKQRQEAANTAVLAGITSSLGYREAQARASEALIDYAEKAADGETSTADLDAAQRDAESAALAQAAAAVQLAEDQAAASGATLDSEAKARIYKEELQRLSGFMSGDLLAAVQGYIDTLGRIPSNVNTNVAFGSSTAGATNSAPIRRFHGGGLADGQSFANLQPNEVPAILQKGEAVLTPEQQSAVMTGGGMGGGNITVNINMPPGSNGDDVVRAIRQWERRNGPYR